MNLRRILSVAALCCLPALTSTVRVPLRPVAARTPAPAFYLENAAGKPVSLGEYRGQVVVLNFWATDCGGCGLELPWLVEVQESFQGKNVALLGISMDISYEDLKNAAEAWTKVKPFVAAHRLTYPILMGDAAVAHAYNITALPVTYLIDTHGRLAATYAGLIDRQDIESSVAALLKEPR